MNNRVCRNGTPLDMRHDNIALAARRLGYDPTLFGYTDVAPDPRGFAAGDPVLTTYEGVLPGFTVRRQLPEHQKAWLSWLAMRGVDSSAGFPDIHRPASGPAGRVTNAPPVYSKDETPGAFLTDEFLRWLSEQDGYRPWFAHVSYLSPHPPFIVPEPYNTMYDPAGGPDFARAADWQSEAKRHPFTAYMLDTQERCHFVPGMEGLVRDWSEAEIRQIRAIYDGMISDTDAQLGRLWAGLKASGDWDDTLIVLTSDHAEMMGDHYMLGKGGFFEGSFHIPLVVRDPRRAASAGRIVEQFTEAVDIMPTMLDLLEAEVPAHLDGSSLKPFLDGSEPAGWRDAAHWEFDFRSVSDSSAERRFGLPSRLCNLAVIRNERFKYVHFGGGLPPQLYDLGKDSDELDNVAEDPAYLSVRLQLAEALLAWRAGHLDQTLALAELTPDGVAGHVAGLPPWRS
jgi:arylsulfatase A-like enzyme